jgi:hypothetical protein
MMYTAPQKLGQLLTLQRPTGIEYPLSETTLDPIVATVATENFCPSSAPPAGTVTMKV